MAVRIKSITFDCADPYHLAQFWTQLTGFSEDPDNGNAPGDPEALLLSPDGSLTLLFIAVPEPKQVKNRVHLDLVPLTSRRDEEVGQLLRTGARMVADQRRPDGGGWVVLSDPEGNEFCIARSDAERAPLAEQLGRAFDAVARLISNIRADQWSAPTTCTDWTVRQLVNHLIGMNRVFAALLADQPPPPRPSADHVEDDPVGAYRDSAAALQAAFGRPGVLERTYHGPLGAATGAERLKIRLYDLLAHGWDLAQATEQPADLPDDLAEQSLVFARTQLTEQARPGRFGPAQIVAEQAPAIERLVAFLGRPASTGRWAPGGSRAGKAGVQRAGGCASMTRMAHDLVHPPKARPGDRIAVLSPSFAAAGAFPAVHEQAMRRLTEVTGLIPVEYPTTRKVGATPQERAADINAAFADPAIRAVLAVVGGEDQITVIPHLDAGLARRDPKPFLGTSDNTNLHHWLWANGVASFYGASSQVHLGPGPGVDDVHARSLRAALITGETLEITDPGESEDVGVDWGDPRALSSFGEREPTEPWSWHGPARSVTGRTWGGCLEVIEEILTAGRFPFEPDVLDGGVLIIETSEELLPARNVGWIVRALGERGILAAVHAVLVARPAVSDFTRRPPADERARLRAEQREVVAGLIDRYNPEAVVCVGVPFGHTRPQWIVPHGGAITVDGAARRTVANYS